MKGKPDWSFRNERWLICGPSGCGKTTLSLFVANGIRARGDVRAFAFDQKAEMWRRLGLEKLCVTAADVAAQSAMRAPVAYCPGTMFPGATDRGLIWLSEFVWRFCRAIRNEFLFILDEVQDFVGPARQQVPKALGCLIESGRGYKVHSICIAQSANLVNARLRQQFNRVAIFRQTDETATAPLRAWGLDPDAVAALKPFNAMIYDRETGSRRIARLSKSSGRESVAYLPAP